VFINFQTKPTGSDKEPNEFGCNEYFVLKTVQCLSSVAVSLQNAISKLRKFDHIPGNLHPRCSQSLLQSSGSELKLRQCKVNIVFDLTPVIFRLKIFKQNYNFFFGISK